MEIVIEKKALRQDEILQENPILPLKNMLFFPGVPTPVNVGRSKSLKLVQEIQKKGGIVGDRKSTRLNSSH